MKKLKNYKNKPDWRENKLLPIWLTIAIILWTYILIKEPNKTNQINTSMRKLWIMLKITEDLINIFLTSKK